MQGNLEYRKVQGILGEQSFCVVLPKHYALSLGFGFYDARNRYIAEEND
jgi:hypothetical protein